MINTLLFDLDGTLLGMDEKQFVRLYMKSLTAAMAPYGYQPESLIEALIKGEQLMRQNDGSKTNETIMLDLLSSICHKDARADLPLFEQFYTGDGFAKASIVCHPIEGAKELIDELKKRGYRLILASNPLFPKCAMESRLRWAGLNPQDFEWIASYENASSSKADPRFFRELAKDAGFVCKEALMIGNSPDEDGNAAKAGLDVFLFEDMPDYDRLRAYLDAKSKQRDH